MPDIFGVNTPADWESLQSQKLQNRFNYEKLQDLFADRRATEAFMKSMQQPQVQTPSTGLMTQAPVPLQLSKAPDPVKSQWQGYASQVTNLDSQINNIEQKMQTVDPKYRESISAKVGLDSLYKRREQLQLEQSKLEGAYKPTETELKLTETERDVPADFPGKEITDARKAELARLEVKEPASYQRIVESGDPNYNITQARSEAKVPPQAEKGLEEFSIVQNQGRSFNQLSPFERQQTTVAYQEASIPDAGTMELMARDYMLTHKVPSFGIGNSALTQIARTRFFKAVGNVAREMGLTEDMGRANRAAFKANEQALGFLKKNLEFTKGAEKGAISNGQTVLAAAALDSKNTGIPAFQRWINAGRTAAGDPEVTRLQTAINAYSSERAKVLSGSLGMSGVSDAARKEVNDTINSWMNLDQLSNGISIGKFDMENMTQARQDVYNETKAELSEIPKAPKKGEKPKAPAGLPEGTVDNGDGTFTLPGGKTIRKKVQ